LEIISNCSIYYTLNATFFIFLTVGYPKIIRGPASQPVATGKDTEFSIEIIGNHLQFQWQKDGIDLSDGDKYQGVNTDTLCITTVKESDEGHYRCFVMSDVGKHFLDEAFLRVSKLLSC